MARTIRGYLALCLAIATLTGTSEMAQASDHADTHELDKLKVPAAKIGDFYMFEDQGQLVLAITTLAPVDAANRISWDRHIIYNFHLDRNSEVSLSDGSVPTVTTPEDIKDDVQISVRIMPTGGNDAISFQAIGLEPSAEISHFHGLRDEPFIRGGLEGKNLPAIVVSIPIENFKREGDDSIVLDWATSTIEGVGHQLELAGHPYGSQASEADKINYLHPSDHGRMFSVAPDVLIYDVSKPAAYPNGRSLKDDVVDILNRVGRAPFPSQNDIPFLATFPYLAAPHGSQTN